MSSHPYVLTFGIAVALTLALRVIGIFDLTRVFYAYLTAATPATPPMTFGAWLLAILVWWAIVALGVRLVTTAGRK